MNDALNRATIMGHEGLRLKVYRDTRGLATIGWGFALEKFGPDDAIVESTSARVICNTVNVDYDALRAGTAELTTTQADLIFDMQYMRVRSAALLAFPDLNTMPDNAAAVVCDMIYEMGFKAFCGFQHFIQAMKAERWAVAIQHMEASLWATEVPHRVADDVKLMESIGADPILKG